MQAKVIYLEQYKKEKLSRTLNLIDYSFIFFNVSIILFASALLLIFFNIKASGDILAHFVSLPFIFLFIYHFVKTIKIVKRNETLKNVDYLIGYIAIVIGLLLSGVFIGFGIIMPMKEKLPWLTSMTVLSAIYLIMIYKIHLKTKSKQ